MILVTGASGKTGRAVVAALARTGAAARAVVRRPSQVAQLLRLGAREAVVADLLDESSLSPAFRDAGAVVHICPNIHPEEIEIGRRAIALARAHGVAHFVLHSVLHPQIEQMPHHWTKLRVEEALLDSGLACTILRPAAYMQNWLTGWRRIVDEGVLRNPYAVDTRLSVVDLEDVAQAAAIVLTEAEHAHATYDLVGTRALTQTEVAAALSEGLGRPVHAEAEPLEEWEARARGTGLGEYQRATLAAMFRYYARHGLSGNPRVLRWLLGREPTTIAAFARRTARAG